MLGRNGIAQAAQDSAQAGPGQRVLQSRALTRAGRPSCAFVRPAAECKNPQHDEVQDRDKAEEAPSSGVSSLINDPPHRDDVGRKNEKNDQPVPDAHRAHVSP